MRNRIPERREEGLNQSELAEAVGVTRQMINVIERKASDYTLSVFAFVLVLGALGGIILEEGGVVTLPAAFSGAMWTLVAVYAVFGVIYTVLRNRT